MFDYRSFLTEQCSTPQNVLVLFSAYGIMSPQLNIWSIEKWFQRGRVSGQFLPLLLAVLELEHGEPVRLAKYIK